MARKRGLTPEDRDIWDRVARTAQPLHPKRKQIAPEALPVKPARPKTAEPREVPLFRVGQSAGLRSAQSSLMSSPAEQLAVNPVRMDHKTHRKMTRGKLKPEARLDLHGMTLAVAQPELQDFILSCHTRGLRLVLVITGKGRGNHGPLPTRPGALRHHVPIWLQQPPLSRVVMQVTAAHLRHGGEGAYYVYLRR